GATQGVAPFLCLKGSAQNKKGKLLEGRASKSRVLQLAAIQYGRPVCEVGCFHYQPASTVTVLVFYLFEVVFQGSNDQGGQGRFLDDCKDLQLLSQETRAIKVYVFWAGVLKAREHAHIHISMMP
ncbi:hypothetical protein, partial [Actinotignum sp. GS-2025c]|uniref:hypothetical protein n=1 Tax=Actinotignum sp. GS-2025c TaxID=3427276 RepID=UPI003F46CAB9